jgi:TRAP-type uncharacterized transport system substrate-binding protein
VGAALWGTGALLHAVPPRTVTMATGLEGGAYQEVGQRYREILAHHGVTLTLLPTAGALENLARLRDPRSKVTVGLLQNGLTSPKESPELESLGTVFYEVLWFFHRGVIDGPGLQRLRGRTVSVGPEGSGTRTLALSHLRMPLSYTDLLYHLRGHIALVRERLVKAATSTAK